MDNTSDTFIRNESDVTLRFHAVELAENIALNVLLHPEEREQLKSAFEEIKSKLKEGRETGNSGP
jgi:hypothetical protein